MASTRRAWTLPPSARPRSAIIVSSLHSGHSCRAGTPCRHRISLTGRLLIFPFSDKVLDVFPEPPDGRLHTAQVQLQRHEAPAHVRQVLAPGADPADALVYLAGHHSSWLSYYSMIHYEHAKSC
jgi:hypothetical protein